MSAYKSYKDIIEAWGTVELAESLGVKQGRVRQWKSRNKIPSDWHWKIATKRKARTLKVSMRLLESLGD